MAGDIEYATVGCEICDTEFQVREWYGGKCPKCGTAVEYDEGYALSLTSEQKALLASFAFSPEKPTEDGWYFYSSEKNPCLVLRHEKGRFWVQIPRGYDYPIIFKPKDGLWCHIPDPPKRPRVGGMDNG